MAIKGKGRSKSRGVARAPRRPPVAVPVPVLRRRWVQLTAVFLLGLGVFLFGVWLTNGLRTSAETDRAAEELTAQQLALQSWQGEVEAQIGKVGQLQDIQPPVVGQSVRSALQQLQDDGKTTVTDDDLTSTAEALAGAADALDGFDLAGAIRDKGFGTEVDTLLSSRVEFVQSLRAVRSAALLVIAANGTEDDATRSAILKRAGESIDTADALMADAYRRYRLVLTNAGIAPAPTTPGLPTTQLP